MIDHNFAVEQRGIWSASKIQVAAQEHPYAFRVKQVHALAGHPEVELNCRPITNVTSHREGASTTLSREALDFDTSPRGLELTIDLLDPRRVGHAESRIRQPHRPANFME